MTGCACQVLTACSLVFWPQIPDLGPGRVRLRGAHQAGVDGVSYDPALGVQQDGLHMRWVRPEAALQPGAETCPPQAALRGEAVRRVACAPAPIQVPQPWFLVSLAPGRSCGSAVKSHMLSSVDVPQTHTHTCTRPHARTRLHTVPSQVQSPPLATPTNPSLAQAWNTSSGTVTECITVISPGCWGGREGGLPLTGPPPSALFASPGALGQAPAASVVLWCWSLME